MAKKGIIMLLLELLGVHTVVVPSVIAAVAVVVHTSEAIHPTETTQVVRAIRKVHWILLAPLLLLLLLVSELCIAPVRVLGANASKAPHAASTGSGEVQVVGAPRELRVALDGCQLLLLLHHGLELLLLRISHLHAIHVLETVSSL